ncbi:MAG: hypothetical protein HQK77_06345 [Desulfobacterales bacterium]|nr:hypothetical protein [Desulfobacterales bacterium]
MMNINPKIEIARSNDQEQTHVTRLMNPYHQIIQLTHELSEEIYQLDHQLIEQKTKNIQIEKHLTFIEHVYQKLISIVNFIEQSVKSQEVRTIDIEKRLEVFQQLSNQEPIHGCELYNDPIQCTSSVTVDRMKQVLQHQLDLLETHMKQFIQKARYTGAILSVLLILGLVISIATYAHHQAKTQKENSLLMQNIQKINIDVSAFTSKHKQVQEQFHYIENRLLTINKDSEDIQQQIRDHIRIKEDLTNELGRINEKMKSVETEIKNKDTRKDTDKIKNRVNSKKNNHHLVLFKDVYNEQWILKQRSTAYTIQLMCALKRESIDAFLKSYSLIPIACYQEMIKGNLWFVIIWGNYSKKIEAEKAIQTLPLGIQSNSPCIRQFNTIHKKIKK